MNGTASYHQWLPDFIAVLFPNTHSLLARSYYYNNVFDWLKLPSTKLFIRDIWLDSTTMRDVCGYSVCKIQYGSESKLRVA